MDAEDGVEARHPAKRARITSACRSCRMGSRKLACDGSRPCARCNQDARACTDADTAERTPLTRKRMTDLEEKLAEYERIWHMVCPQWPLGVVQQKVTRIGLNAAAQEIRQACSDSVVPNHTLHILDPHDSYSASTTNHDNSIPDSSKTRPTVTDSDVLNVYPPTRPPSPGTMPVSISLHLHDSVQNTSNAWNEDGAPRDGLSGKSMTGKESQGVTPGNDFGTGVGAGVGYIGLSSGLTLLRTIRKFAPSDFFFSSQRLPDGSKPPDALTAENLAGLSRSAATCDGPEQEIPTLPPSYEIKALVDSYFHYFHTLTPIVHEPTIRAQITGALPLPAGSGSRVLFNMIFAMGAFDIALDDDVEGCGFKYYEKARAAVQQDILEGGSLLLVQGLAIMANWLQRNNKPNAGYVCLGLAIRMATALGAHVSIPASKTAGLTILEAEMRSRIWWALVTLECGQCMTYGRPHGITLPSLFAVEIPINIDDESLTVSTTQPPSNVEHVTLYTALVTQAKLAQMAFSSVDRISRSRPSPTVEQIKWCGDRFQHQLAALPAYMKTGVPGPYPLARAVQVWRARDYQSILYRPVLLAAAWEANDLTASDETTQEIVHVCRSLALQNLQDIALFVRNHADPHRGSEWYTLYFAIQASLTILLSMVWQPHHPSVDLWSAQIEDTIRWLRQLRSMKELGMSYAQLMEDTLAIRAGEREDGDGAPTPMTRHAQQPVADTENLNFERYFHEIWDGQLQNAGIGMDTGFGMTPQIWDDMFRGTDSY